MRRRDREGYEWLIGLANAGRPVAPPLPPADGVPRPPRRLEVFSVGTDSVQLTWSALGAGWARFRAADVTIDQWVDGGPGAIVLEGLPAGRTVRITVDGEALPDGPRHLRATTLLPPPGQELFRLASVNDVHIGQRGSGKYHTLVEIPEPVDLHPVRCLRAALDETQAWGAERLLVKGDLTHASKVEHWEKVGALLEDVKVPVDVVPGNHEGRRTNDIEPQAGLAPHGFRLVRGVQVIDQPGIRIIVGDSTIPRSDWGQVEGMAPAVLRAARRATTGVLLGIHHQPMHTRFPTYIPPGIPGPEAKRFLAELGAANPRTLVSTGHTHRHRRHQFGPVVVTEIGSTKDFPGTWAGYQVYEAGIVQMVRRIAEPSCIRWTDYTRRAAGGLWQFWSPGPLRSRCFSHTWV